MYSRFRFLLHRDSIPHFTSTQIQFRFDCTTPAFLNTYRHRCKIQILTVSHPAIAWFGRSGWDANLCGVKSEAKVHHLCARYEQSLTAKPSRTIRSIIDSNSSWSKTAKAHSQWGPYLRICQCQGTDCRMETSIVYTRRLKLSADSRIIKIRHLLEG